MSVIRSNQAVQSRRVHPQPHRKRRRNPRRGTTLIYVTMSVAALVSVGSLAVDWGRVEMVKTELDRGTSAAARYAAKGISDGTALAKANSLGSNNTVDGAPLSFAASDVETGTWDSTAKTFTPGTSSPNAVRVTGRRTAATGNPVPLVVGQIVGYNTCDVVVKAVAKINVGGYGVVGLTSITMTGNSSDSYWTSGGGSGYGAIASNGNISLSGSTSINGDAHPGVGKTATGGTVTGSRSPLTSSLVYPNGSAGTYATSNDDASVPNSYTSASSLNVGSNKWLILPGGNYYFNNVTISGTLSFIGPATIYCYGSFSMGGNATTSGSNPANLTIVMCPDQSGNPPGNMTVSSGSALYATIYAPQSNVTLSGSGDIYGSVLGNNVTMSGTSAIHYDLSLIANNGTVSIVQ